MDCVVIAVTVASARIVGDLRTELTTNQEPVRLPTRDWERSVWEAIGRGRDESHRHLRLGGLYALGEAQHEPARKPFGVGKAEVEDR